MAKTARTLFSKGGIDARLSFYAPGQHMAAHSHAVHQVSWLLAGEMREGSRSTDRDILQPSVGLKPAGLDHANDYGANGALILSINIDPQTPVDDFSFGFDDWRWTPRAAGQANGRMTAALTRLLAEQGEQAEQAIWDLLALSAREEDGGMAAVPPWLNQVRDQLNECGDELDMAAIAARAGVHRVHLSRAFTRHFGMPPSVYRARCRIARAIAGMVEGGALADIALEAGFSDQAHLSRAAKRETGLTPRALQKLLKAA